MSPRFVKILLAVSLAFNLSFLGAAAFLRHEKSNEWISPFGARMPRDRFLFEDLSLRPDQIRAMRALAVPFRAEVERKRGEIASKRNDLFRMLRADSPDNQAIASAVTAISRDQEELERMVAAHILREKALLDPGQRGKFLDLIQGVMSPGAVSSSSRTPCPIKETLGGA
jgi:Spy/CpxP family protein refolding chaperone